MLELYGITIYISSKWLIVGTIWSGAQKDRKMKKNKRKINPGVIHYQSG